MMDIRIALARLRPISAYHWKGGDKNDYSAIGEWRDKETEKPTLEELQAEWEVYQSELLQVNDKLDAMKETAKAIPGSKITSLLAAERTLLMQFMVHKMAGLNPDLTIKDFKDWL
jgi:hypothetical protein